MVGEEILINSHENEMAVIVLLASHSVKIERFMSRGCFRCDWPIRGVLAASLFPISRIYGEHPSPAS